MRRLLAWLFGPREVPKEVERIILPPEPMFRDPMGGEWKDLTLP